MVQKVKKESPRLRWDLAEGASVQQGQALAEPSGPCPSELPGSKWLRASQP